VNIALRGLGDAGWVSLHGPGPLPAPFGIACTRLPVLPTLVGAPVRVEPDAVVIDGVLRVRLDRACPCDTTIPPSAPLPDVTACLTEARAGVRSGLLPVVRTVLAGARPPDDPLARLAAPALARLLEATAAREAAGCVAAAEPLLGLGPGLTPSGDDCLVGWATGMRAVGAAERCVVEGMAAKLLAAAAERTTALSRAFLAAALAGDVAEPVHRFVRSPDAHGLSVLLALGATSGADLLAGYLLARQALGRREGIAVLAPPPPPPVGRGQLTRR